MASGNSRRNPSNPARHRASAQKIAICSVMVALGLILSYVEVLFPFNFGVPGIKLGLSNLVVLIALYQLGAGYALTINLMRIVLSGLLFSGISGMIYSLAGGLASFAVMFILKKTGIFSPVGVSLAGGVMHNAGQILVAVAVTETAQIFWYLPVLMVSGMITGILLGIAAILILRRFRKIHNI